MSVGTASAETTPRDLAHIRDVLRPSSRFRIMNQLGAFSDQADKVAYSSSTPDEQAQRLLATLQAIDSGAGMPTPQPQQTQQPMVQQQVQQPMMAPMQPQQMQQQPMMAPMAPQVQQPMMAPMAPQQVQQPMMAPMAPMAPMQPQQPMRAPMAPMQSAAAAPAAPAAPMGQGMAPRMPQAAGGGGLFGGAAPNAAQPQTVQRTPVNSSADSDPLTTIINNQKAIAAGIQGISSSLQELVGAIGQMQSSGGSGVDPMNKVLFFLLMNFMEGALGGAYNKAAIIGAVQAALTSGEIDGCAQQVTVGENRG